MPVRWSNHSYSNNARIELTGHSLQLEAELFPTTAELNDFPLKINRKIWLRNLESAEESANFLIDWCRHLSGNDTFRPNSSADCARILIARGHQLPTSKGSGKPSTSADTLNELANHGDNLAGPILEARSAISIWSQLKSWKQYADLGYVQPVWDSMGQPHGRYSCEAPCLNNRVPWIRETIEPEEGFCFLSLDLSQAEYVSWASLSQDPTLSHAFLNGTDFHTAMAEGVRKLVPSWKTNGNLRDCGKTLNFAVLYQMQPHTLARKLGCSVEIATKIVSSYYSRIPVATEYLNNVLAEAEALGWVETYFGRRRYCPEYQFATGARDIHEIEKYCWHHKNAGTAAEFLKFKQLKVWNALRDEGFNRQDVRLSINNYDELIFTVNFSVLEEVRAIASHVMRERVEGFLPFQSEVQIGANWGEIK